MMIYLAIAGAAMVLFWVDDGDERERLRAYAVTLGGGDRARLPHLRVERQPARGVRRSVAGVAVRCAARRRADVWPRLAFAGGLEAPARAGRRRRARHRRLPCADVAALPSAARGRVARSRAAVAEPRQGSAAGLPARLAHRDVDRGACRSPARSAGWPADRGCDGARPRAAAAAIIGAALARLRGDACCCSGRRAPDPPRR